VMLNIGRLSEGLLGRDEEVVCFHFILAYQFTLRINQKSTEVRALDHIQTLSWARSPDAGRAQHFRDSHRRQDRLGYIELSQAIRFPFHFGLSR